MSKLIKALYLEWLGQIASSFPLQMETSDFSLRIKPRAHFSQENGSSPRGEFHVWVLKCERKKNLAYDNVKPLQCMAKTNKQTTKNTLTQK